MKKEEKAATLKRRMRRTLLRKMRDFSGGYVRYNDASSANYNPCRVNDGALLDLKSRHDATTHARRCPHCACPLYRDEVRCPLCGHARAFFGFG